MQKLFSSILLLTVFNLYSQNYTLDNSFGINGAKKYFETTNNSEPLPVCVFYNNNKYILVQNYKISCFKYNGDRDLSFGTNGQFKLSTTSNNFYLIKGAKLISDKIYIFGYHEQSYYRNAFVARILLNGTFDVTFGNAGVSIFDIGQTDNIYEDDDDCFNDIKVNADGSIYALGKTSTLISPEIPFQPGRHSYPVVTLSKITASQTIDTTFAPNRYIDYGTGTGVKILDYQSEMLLVTHTKLVLVDNSGALVTSFGNNGIKNVNSGLVNAYIFNGNTIYLSYLFGTTGGVFGDIKAMDLTSFSILATIQTGGSAVFEEYGGKVYIVDGTCGSCSLTGTSDFRVRRYNSDATLDTSFDSDGQYTHTFPSMHYPQSYATGIYLHDDGKIFMAGRAKTLLLNDTGAGIGMIRLEVTSLGITEFNKFFTIAQNPVNEKLYLINKTAKEIDFVTIIDNTGRALLTKYGNIDNLDVSFLQDGIYYIKISSENNYQTLKFLKK